jgi:rod shape-determining protein MreC
MLYWKMWWILLSIMLILLDKFSFINKIRDSSSIYLHKQIAIIEYRITNYPRLILLQKHQQRNLEIENLHLKKQIEQYATIINQQKNQTATQQELDGLKFNSKLYNNFAINVARTIIDINYLVNNKVLIDKGSLNKVALGNVVVNKEGVVGQIIATNPQNAQVTLITNPEYSIYVQNNSSKSKMLAQGMGNNALIVKYINKRDTLKVGDILVTTGLDDLYPGNLPVARITKIFSENNGFNKAICEPIVNFNKLQYVLVLKNAT